MKVSFTILHHGYIENDFAWNVAVPHPASIDNKNPPAEWIRVPTFSVLIKHDDLGYVLYDTGPCPGDEADRLPEYPRKYMPYFTTREDLLDNRLKLIGLTPSDISTLIVSHMHWDHCGGLNFFTGTKVGTRIYAHKDDFSYGLLTTHKSQETFAGGGYFKQNFEFEGLSYNLIEEDETLAEGLEIITLEGHTPGILGLVVHIKSGVYIFPSDAVYMAKNYGPPEIIPGILYDSLGFKRSIAKLRKLQKKYDASLIFPHDPQQFETLKRCPFFYE